MEVHYNRHQAQESLSEHSQEYRRVQRLRAALGRSLGAFGRVGSVVALLGLFAMYSSRQNTRDSGSLP